MIEVRNLTKAFGEQRAVDDVSFAIARGETFALLGPNGSGKSTTLKCMVGLIRPTSGDTRIDGIDVWKRPKEARRLLSYLPQRTAFQDNLTAREVMEFYCRLRKISISRIDQLLNASRFDFDGFADRRIGEFSGGMVQRLGLAVACLPDAPVLILDEPTVSLDPEGALQFREFLSALKKEGKTVVFSSHMLADVESLADRVAILVGGKLVALESVRLLREQLAGQSRMRIIARNITPLCLQEISQKGARQFELQGDTLLISANAEDRLAILDTIQRSGAIISRFSTEELSLEDVYVQFIHKQDPEARSDASDHSELRKA